MTNGHGSHPTGPDDTTRGRLATIIRQNPGLNIQELADAVGVTRTAALYAVRGLLKDGAVRTTRVGRHVLHFPRSMDEVEQKALTALRVESLRNVVDVIFKEPRFTWSELSDKVMVSTRTVRRAIRRLESEGLVELERVRGPHDFHAHLHPGLRVLLARWKGPERRDLRLPKPKSFREWLWLLPDLVRSAFSPV